MKLFCLLGFCVCLGFCVWSLWIAGAVFFGLLTLGLFIIDMGNGKKRLDESRRRTDILMDRIRQLETEVMAGGTKPDESE